MFMPFLCVKKARGGYSLRATKKGVDELLPDNSNNCIIKLLKSQALFFEIKAAVPCKTSIVSLKLYNLEQFG